MLTYVLYRARYLVECSHLLGVCLQAHHIVLQEHQEWCLKACHRDRLHNSFSPPNAVWQRVSLQLLQGKEGPLLRLLSHFDGRQ